MSAKAVLAVAVMHLHADKIWKGQAGFGHGCPFAWVYSPEHNTASCLGPLDRFSVLVMTCRLV